MQQAPEAVLASFLPDLRRDEAGDPGAKARLEAMLDRMLAWRALGCVGAIRPDEAEACLSDVRDFLRDAFVAFPFHRAAGLAGLRLDYVEQVALPRISRPEPEAAPDDEAALAAMPML